MLDDQALRQRQHQGKGMLRNSNCVAAAHVRHLDIALLQQLQVELVAARVHPDQDLQSRRVFDDPRRQHPAYDRICPGCWRLQLVERDLEAR